MILERLARTCGLHTTVYDYAAPAVREPVTGPAGPGAAIPPGLTEQVEAELRAAGWTGGDQLGRLTADVLAGLSRIWHRGRPAPAVRVEVRDDAPTTPVVVWSSGLGAFVIDGYANPGTFVLEGKRTTLGPWTLPEDAGAAPAAGRVAVEWGTVVDGVPRVVSAVGETEARWLAGPASGHGRRGHVVRRWVATSAVTS